jgi:hypothetical protein
MKHLEQVRKLQSIANMKSDRALTVLAQANAEVRALEARRQETLSNLGQQRRDAHSTTEIKALEAFELWSQAAVRNLDMQIASHQTKVSSLREQARLDFGKAQVLKRLATKKG